MNKQDVSKISEVYKQYYTYYKLNNYVNSDTLTGLRTLMNDLSLLYVPIENSVILESEYMHNCWNDICDYKGNKVVCTQSAIDWYMEEVNYSSDSQKQADARIEVIKGFRQMIQSKGLIIPE